MGFKQLATTFGVLDLSEDWLQLVAWCDADGAVVR
jgi:hypothetical protein